MKKAILALSVLMMCMIVFVGCNKDDKITVSEYVTDASGEVVTNEDGEKETTLREVEETSIEYVTDANGEDVIDDDGEKVTTIVEKTPEDENDETTTEKPTQPQTTVPVDVTIPVEGTTVVKPVEERIFETKYKPIIKSGKYLIEMTIQDEIDGKAIDMPLMFATNGESLFIEIQLDGEMTGLLGGLKTSFLCKGTKTYMILPTLKRYIEAPTEDEMLFDPAEMQDGFNDDSAKYKSTTKASYGGIEYICEEYVSDNTSYKYYFTTDTKDLKRIEFIQEGQEPMISNFAQFYGNPADSYFEIPSNYKLVDLSTLESLVSLFS